MVWVVDESAVAAENFCAPICLSDGESDNASLVEWVKGLVKIETERLKTCGFRVLSLIPKSCSGVRLVKPCSAHDTAASSPKDREAKDFNRVVFATAFDFGKAQSLNISVERHQFKGSEPAWCVFGIMTVGQPQGQGESTSTQMMISFPFVYRDEGKNTLQHWTLVNSAGQAQYIILQPRDRDNGPVESRKQLSRECQDDQSSTNDKQSRKDTSERKGEKYVGPVDAEGKGHGVGRLRYEAGIVFCGEFLHGKMHQGVLYNEDSTFSGYCMKDGTWENVSDAALLETFPAPKGNGSASVTTPPTAEPSNESRADLQSQRERSVPADQQKGRKSCSSTLHASRISLLRAVLDRLSPSRRVEALRFYDAQICERSWNNLQALLVHKKTRDAGTGSQVDTEDIMRKLDGSSLNLLRAVEFVKVDGVRVMGLSADFLSDSEVFLACLERSCPRLLSGRRLRRASAEWPLLLEPPARELTRLQVRVAQLVEQKLWALLEDPSLRNVIEQATIEILSKVKQAKLRKKKVKNITHRGVESGVEVSPKDESDEDCAIEDDDDQYMAYAESTKRSTKVSMWRKASADAKGGPSRNIREEAVLWRCLGRGGESESQAAETDPLAPLRGQLCINCQTPERRARGECYCLVPKMEHPSNSESPPSEHPSTSSSSSYDASRLLKECFQLPMDNTEVFGQQDVSLARPWRPINPCVGASVQWRRCENAHWRLFWAAQAHRRAAEEAEAELARHWPNTPSTLGFDQDPVADLSDFGLDASGLHSIVWQQLPSLPSMPQAWNIPHQSPHAASPTDLSAALQQLACHNTELEQRVAQLEGLELDQAMRQKVETAFRAGHDQAEALSLAQRNAELEEQVCARDASINELQERVAQLERTLQSLKN